MEPFDIIGNITKPLLKLILNTIKEMLFDKINPIKTFFLFFGDQPPFDMQSWDIFARLAARFGVHYEIFYECGITEPLTLLRDVISDLQSAPGRVFA